MSPTGARIRRADPADADVLRELARAHIDGHADSDWPVFDSLSRGTLTDDGRLLDLMLKAVDVHSGEIVGVAAAFPPIGPLRDALPDDEAYVLCQLVAKLSAVAVLPSARGRGIGYRLVLRTIAEFRSVEYRQLYGQFHQHDEHLVAFYTHLGFDILGLGETLPILDGRHVGVAPADPDERWFTQSLIL